MHIINMEMHILVYLCIVIYILMPSFGSKDAFLRTTPGVLPKSKKIFVLFFYIYGVSMVDIASDPTTGFPSLIRTYSASFIRFIIGLSWKGSKGHQSGVVSCHCRSSSSMSSITLFLSYKSFIIHKYTNIILFGYV